MRASHGDGAYPVYNETICDGTLIQETRGSVTESDDEIGFVICAACGARIKADREWCLRCHEPLVAWKRPEIPLPSWVRALGGGTMIFGVVLVAAVGLVAYLAFDSGSTTSDVVPPPPRQSASTTTAAPAGMPVTEKRLEPVLFVDTKNRGSVEITSRDLADARERFEQALQSDPRNADAQNNLGLVLERLEHLDMAVAHFAEAAAIEDHNWVYHFNLAHALSLQRRWSRAASEYATAVELVSSDYAVQYDFAAALHMASNDPAAIRAFERAIELAPNEPAAHLGLGISLDANGRVSDALGEYRRYLELLPAAADVASVRARMETLASVANTR
ncbi:MAG TPA: tetratricopeptide repeat protein [Vicinamibacterales bacterium]|nr:tetratricopeptide repeat protein [Vicinamibacterales bacterium]